MSEREDVGYSFFRNLLYSDSFLMIAAYEWIGCSEKDKKEAIEQRVKAYCRKQGFALLYITWKGFVCEENMLCNSGKEFLDKYKHYIFE